MQEHQRVGNQREGRHRDRYAEIVGVDLSELPVCEQGTADRRPADGHECDHWDQGQHCQPGGQRKIRAYGRFVVGGGISAQSWHDYGQNRHADDPEGQLEYQPGVGVNRRTGGSGGTGDPVTHHQPDLTDQHVEHHCRGHRAEAFEPVVDSPQRPQADAFGADRDQQYRGLRQDTQCCSDTEDQQFGVAHLHRIDRKFPRDNQIQTEGGNRDDVVDHRRPGRRPEHVAVVQDRHEDRGQSVEDHLRQQ